MIFIESNGLGIDVNKLKYSDEDNIIEIYRGDNFIGVLDLEVSYLKFKRKVSSTKFYKVVKREV